MMASELENLERDWEMTVLPQPKAPGIEQVPPDRGEKREREGSDYYTLCQPLLLGGDNCKGGSTMAVESQYRKKGDLARRGKRRLARAGP